MTDTKEFSAYADGEPNAGSYRWYRILDRVPTWFRSRWPMRRWFWQRGEIDAAFAEARKWRETNRWGEV